MMPSIGRTLIADGSPPDQELAKENALRKELASVFNKTATDFPSLKQYNDYLEEVEDIIEDMIRGTPQQKDSANKKIKKYKVENEEIIHKNNMRRFEEKRKIKADIDQIEIETKRALEDDMKEEEEVRIAREKGHQEYLADIQSGRKRPMDLRPQTSEQIRAKIAEQRDLEAAQHAKLQTLILQQHENEKRRNMEAAAMMQKKTVLNRSVLKLHQVAWSRDSSSLTPHQKLALAGGWSEDYAVFRATEEALSSLLFNV